MTAMLAFVGVRKFVTESVEFSLVDILPWAGSKDTLLMIMQGGLEGRSG